QEHPGAGGMEVEMTRAEAEAVLWCDGDLIRQRARVVVEDLQSSRVLARGCGRFVATCHEDDGAVRGQDANLMRVDTGIERRALRHFCTHTAVGVDRMNGHSARTVVRREQISSGPIAGDVDGT